MGGLPMRSLSRENRVICAIWSQELQTRYLASVDMNRLWVALVAALLIAACETSTSPVDEFCREAGTLLSSEDFDPDPEDAVIEQMDELAQLVELLPEGEQEPVLELIDDLRGQVQAFEDGQAPDGWRSEAVVEHVGTLCDRDDLVWHMVIP